MHSRYRSLLIAAVLGLTNGAVSYADPAPFDLAGPTLEVKVTRAEKTLPVSQVPNLAAGDRLWLQADWPATQSAHYLLVVAFLRGATNPPPESWFFSCETWKRKCAQSGLTVTVPQDAQQVLMFLAPETGGDFKTLVGAVRGRPGAFVRASQDLNQASLDRSRLEAYLTAIRRLNLTDPAGLKQAAPLLARSLAIRVDEKCLGKIPQLQAPCLMDSQNSLILNDGHSTSIVEALTSGPASDLAMQASFTPQLSYGYYSPYIASVLDIARILDSFHTAQYQYIPALVSQSGDRLALTLNTPPSFRNPKSVIVVALPAVEQPQLPPLHAVDTKELYCARKSLLVLPVEGAPLAFSTGYVHDITLSLTGKDGKRIDLPAAADAEKGGYVIDTSALGGATLGDSIRGSLHGFWGFDQYDGPNFELTNAHAQTWELASPDDGTLVVGRDATIHLQASSVSCVDQVMLKDPSGKELKAEWKAVKPNEVEVTLPLKEVQAGSMSLLVSQYGAKQPQSVALQAFSDVTHLEHFTLHAGDAQGVLKGSRLDAVTSLVLKGAVFSPGKLSVNSSGAQGDELSMTAQDSQAVSAFKLGDSGRAKVTLNDGRVIYLATAVEAPRPIVTLIGKSIQPSPSSSESNIQLANEDELPQDARLTFSVRAQLPAAFSRDQKIEVATADESFSTTLSLANGGLTLGDAKVAVATLEPVRAFGASAFGPLRFRAVVNGSAGDWQPLATLVRLPVLKELKCPAQADLACRLTGVNLFLIDSISGNAQFDHAVQVPDGFPGYALPVPHPTNGTLYVKLRDDTSVVNSVTLGVQPIAANLTQPPSPISQPTPLPAPLSSAQLSSARPSPAQPLPAQPSPPQPSPAQPSLVRPTSLTGQPQLSPPASQQ